MRTPTINFMSTRPSAWKNYAPAGRILITFDIWVFFENLSGNFKFHFIPSRIKDTLHEDVYTFMTISRWILHRMRNDSDKSYRENQNTRFMFSNFFPKTLYEIMSKNLLVPERPQLTFRSVACWIRKTTRSQAHASARELARAHTEICNAYWFPTTTIVTRTRFSVNVIRTLSFSIIILT